LGAYAFDDPAARPIPATFLKKICAIGNNDFQVFGDRIQSVVLPQWPSSSSFFFREPSFVPATAEFEILRLVGGPEPGA